jgi:hypothetical protein
MSHGEHRPNSKVLTCPSLGRPVISQYNPPAARTKRQANNDATRDALTKAHIRTFAAQQFIAAPQTLASQDFGISRCAATDPSGATPYRKTPPFTPSTDGCLYNDSPLAASIFASCCDAHDDCIQACQDSFSNCNWGFQSCTYNQCEDHFAGADNEELLKWGCRNVANFYYNIQTENEGKKEFRSISDAECGCRCADDTDNCNGICRNVMNNPSNCGGCGVTVRSYDFLPPCGLRYS